MYLLIFARSRVLIFSPILKCSDFLFLCLGLPCSGVCHMQSPLVCCFSDVLNWVLSDTYTVQMFPITGVVGSREGRGIERERERESGSHDCV
jgi:hypothetical protein